MQPVNASRLIEAASSMDAADRALLNLWVNHRLPDDAVGQMTGMGPEAVAERRQRIVDRLAKELGVAPEEIASALAPPASGSPTAPANGNRNGNGNGNGNGHAVVTHHDAEPPPEVEPRSAEPVAPEPGPPRRPLVWLAAVAALLLVAMIVVVVLSGGADKSHPRTADARTAPPPPAPASVSPAPASVTPAPAAAVTTSSPPAPRATASRPAKPRPPLAALPGGLRHADGSVFLAGHGRSLRLRLTVRGLPQAHHGHYEVWLYNSIIDSHPLARVRNGRHHLTVTLPPHSAHYRWIDVSFQPVGYRNHSGESVLRSRNPARASRPQLRRRSARRGQLRRVASGSSSASRSK